MQPDARTYLLHIVESCTYIALFIASRTLDQYLADRAFRSSVERELLIIGEAVNRLVHASPDLAQSLTSHRGIIAFRNMLAHSYVVVDNRTVWGLAQHRVPLLRAEAQALLDLLDAGSSC